MEKLPRSLDNSEQKEQINEFELVLESLKNNESIDLSSEEKMNFLNWVVKEKDYLLHGSNIKSIEEFEPRLANCSSKEFGNQEAVFANEDPNITMFYALRNREFRGDAGAGTRIDEETGETSYHFEFKGENVDPGYCLKDGAVYLLDRTNFEQGHNDKGEIIDEWANKKPIKPITKLDVKVEDFPYLNEIVFTQLTSLPEKEYFKEKFGINDLDEFQQKFFQADQELMKTGAFDYRNPELVNNQFKNILEQYDENDLNREQRQQQAEMLWLWYHHAAQDAKERYQENEKAIEFIDKALEYKKISHSPNEITELLSLIYRNRFDDAETYIQNMDDMRKERQEDGSVQEVVNYEKEAARKLFDHYKNQFN